MLTNTRTVRIEWGDCDPAGIIFFPNYFRIFDHSTAMLFETALGMTKFEMLKQMQFAGWPLVHTQARFIKPTRFGDDVDIESEAALGESSFTVDHRLTLRGELCVECSEKRVWTVRDAEGGLASQRVPDAVRAKFGA